MFLIKIILVVIDIFVSLMLFSSGAVYERYSRGKCCFAEEIGFFCRMSLI